MLRKYQVNALKALQESVKNGNQRFLFEMATGTGKTLTSAAVIRLFLRSGNANRVLFLVDRIELENQAIQLLVNPDDGVVAIQTVEKEMSGGQTHRIVEKRMHSENSYEIYSRPFIRKLREVEPGIEDGGAYRLTGSVIPSLKVAVFSLKTLQRMDR